MPPVKKPAKTKLKPPSKRPKKLPYSGWDLTKHGVSQSLLQKFIVCRDRFHIATARALRSTDRKEAMEYGSIFHKLIEWGAEMGKSWTMIKMERRLNEYIRKNQPTDQSILLARIALAQFRHYQAANSKLPAYKYIAQEPVFAEEYTLPACSHSTEAYTMHIPRTKVLLRGRIDEVLEVDGNLWLQENKTKAQINIEVLKDTIPENLQVMFYATAAGIKYKRPVKGIIYNVIRKPGQRQRKTESDADFVKRISGEVESNPSHYFYRIAYSFPRGAVKKWQKEELEPLLYQLYIWWSSIKANPLQPWVDDAGNANPFHGRRSFGVYDPMSNGKGEFFDLLIHGSKRGLVVDNEFFPELQDDD